MSAISALALSGHHPLDRRLERRDRAAGHLAERRTLVPEDPRVAVLVDADPTGDAEVAEDAAQDPHRVLGARVLGIGLDVLERRLGAHALDLELRDEHGRLPVALCANTTGRSVERNQKPVKYRM